MTRRKHARSISGTISFACLLGAAALAAASQTQSQVQTRNQTGAQVQAQLQSAGQSDNPPTAAELVTDYLKQDIFLRPGVGLKKVKIGTTFDQVLKVWGRPTSKGGGIAGNEWTYQLANNTRITLSGGDKVRTMDVAGGLGCPYVTTEGASFGMARYQLATIYGSAPGESDTVTYDHRGISFVLDHGQVSEIQVFAPR